MQVAKYFASLGMNIDKSSFEKADRKLDSFERRIRRLGKIANRPIKLNIQSFGVDQSKLNLVLGSALDAASRRVTFEVSRFVVNDRNLLAALLRAARRLPIPPGGGPHPPLPPGPGGGRPTPGGSRRGSTSVYGSMGGFLGGALALGFGGYGLSQLNKKNQQIVSAQLGNTAVVGAERGPSSFEWLKKQGNNLGFNWLEQAPEFTGFLGSATPLMGYDKSLETYKAFNEFASTRHADPVARKRALKAIQQMAAKGQVNTEELQNQLGDAANFGELPMVFAKAYQEFTGGKETGAGAAKALKAAMKKGQVKTGDILPIVTRILAEMAAPTLENSKKSSQAEQGRYQNTVNEMATLASNNGVEEGFARIFRTLSTGLSESNSLVKTLAESFNQATIDASKLLLFPQSFMRALEGRDSLVADWLGSDKTAQLIDDYSQIKVLFDDIAKSIGSAEWSPTLKATAEEIAGIMRGIAALSIWAQRTSTTGSQVYQDQIDEGASPLKAYAKANWFTFKSTIMPWNANEYAAEYGTQRMANNGENIDPVMGASGLDVDAYWNYVNSQAKDYSLKQFGPQGYGASPSAANAFESGVDTYKQGTSQATTNENKFDVNVVLQSGDPDEISKYFKVQFQNDIDTAMLHFEEK